MTLTFWNYCLCSPNHRRWLWLSFFILKCALVMVVDVSSLIERILNVSTHRRKSSMVPHYSIGIGYFSFFQNLFFIWKMQTYLFPFIQTLRNWNLFEIHYSIKLPHNGEIAKKNITFLDNLYVEILDSGDQCVLWYESKTCKQF